MGEYVLASGLFNNRFVKLRISDGRSLFGGLALLITGIIVANMVQHYVTSGESDAGITRSRLWWEVVLNLQILSVGMIWFCYSDRISDAKGPVRRLHILLCGFAILSALMPSILGTVSAANNWFSIRPGPQTFIGFFIFGVVFWLVTLIAQLWFLGLRNRYAKRKRRKRSVAFYAPALTLAAIALVDAPGGGTTWLTMTPVLLYLQGALPYLLRAIRVRPAKTKRPAT